jgi:rubrerythrin
MIVVFVDMNIDIQIKTLKNIGKTHKKILTLGGRIMAKWKCVVCGYIHQGDQPPDRCPICGAPKSKFVKLDD